MPVLLGEQEKHAGGKQHEGNIAAVVPDKAMAKGQDPQYKRKDDHAGFKEGVVDDIDAQKGKAAQKKRQYGAVNCTGNGSADPQNILVNFQFHGMTCKDS
jgi:hypothetical protein